MDDIVYYVMETQDNLDGYPSCIVTICNTVQVAWQKFHMIMSAAAVSNVVRHGAMIVASDYSFVHSELAPRESVESVGA